MKEIHPKVRKHRQRKINHINWAVNRLHDAKATAKRRRRINYWLNQFHRITGTYHQKLQPAR